MGDVCDYCGGEIEGKARFTIVEPEGEKKFCTVACMGDYDEETP